VAAYQAPDRDDHREDRDANQDITARIERKQILAGLINEYRRAA
jgi:hypothetical protein